MNLVQVQRSIHLARENFSDESCDNFSATGKCCSETNMQDLVDTESVESIDFSNQSENSVPYDVVIGGGVDWQRTFAVTVCAIGALLGMVVGWWLRIEMKRVDCSIDVLLSSHAGRVMETLYPANVTIMMIGGTTAEFRSMIQGAVGAHSRSGSIKGVYHVNLFPSAFKPTLGMNGLEKFCTDAEERKQVIMQRMAIDHVDVLITDAAVDTVTCNSIGYSLQERELALQTFGTNRASVIFSSQYLTKAALVVCIEDVLKIDTVLKLSNSATYRMVLFGKSTDRGIREVMGAACDNGFVPIGVLRTSVVGCGGRMQFWRERKLSHDLVVTLARQADARQAAQACQQGMLDFGRHSGLARTVEL